MTWGHRIEARNRSDCVGNGVTIVPVPVCLKSGRFIYGKACLPRSPLLPCVFRGVEPSPPLACQPITPRRADPRRHPRCTSRFDAAYYKAVDPPLASLFVWGGYMWGWGRPTLDRFPNGSSKDPDRLSEPEGAVRKGKAVVKPPAPSLWRLRAVSGTGHGSVCGECGRCGGGGRCSC